MAPERRAVSPEFTRLTQVNPLSDAGGTGLRPRAQGASPSLGKREARAQQAGPGAQHCPFSESLFPARDRRAPRKGNSDDRRGAARAPPRAPLGGRTERRGSQRPGLRANGGSRAGERASSTGAPRPGHPRGSRRRTPRAAAPLAPRLARTSPRLGTLQLGGSAGRAREFPGRAGAGRGGGLSPGSVSPALPAGLPRPPPPPRAAHPGRARAARRPLPRAPHGARAAIATHRGRRGSGPPIHVAPSFPG